MLVQIKHKIFHLAVLLMISVAATAQQDSSQVGAIYKERGIASYYAHKFNGRKTSSGVIFHEKQLTAAHKTLPFGTKVKVTNVKTGRWVIVEINDRGPRSRKRIIDVSYRAAKHLGMLNGVGKVEVIVEQIPLIQQSADEFRKHEVE